MGWLLVLGNHLSEYKSFVPKQTNFYIHFPFPIRLVKAYKKIHKFCNVIAYFSTRHWEFRSERVRAICEDMSKEDKELFFCDLRKIDWDEYFKEYIKGIRLYLLQDPLETLEAARVKWSRLAVFLWSFLGLLWWFCWF